MVALLCSTSLCGDITVGDACLVSNIKAKCCWRRENLVTGGLKFHALKIGSRKKHCRKKSMRCNVVSMKSSDFSASMIGKTLKSDLSSSEVTRVLMSFPDTDSKFSYFKSVAENSNLVHTTDTCNYMLEALRFDGKIEEMAYVFDLMQKRIIKRDTNTYLTIFKSISVKGGLR